MFDSPIIKPGDPIPKPHMTSVPLPLRDFRVSNLSEILEYWHVAQLIHLPLV